MGRRFRNFFKKRGKKREEKKRKLKIGDIQVLFETGTSGPHAPSSVPTTSGHTDTQAIPEQPDTRTGFVEQEGLDS
ncbi:hypothetical protein HOLleu_33458 [Holothuria leucospilota]|uniref:Uncharacterized protein n=1 Tax=Holothuria leucospilota TaxID=206669 RepID=A0A9Q1BI25_HOLLE|nr:hypothetical protein HOLleu_33458 [Holothuria leucospilota]